MLLALSGITGVGKSFYAEEIARKLDFKKVHTIRTRTMRPGEQNGKTGLFMSHEELQMHIKKMKIYLMKIMYLRCIIRQFKTGKE